MIRPWGPQLWRGPRLEGRRARLGAVLIASLRITIRTAVSVAQLVHEGTANCSMRLEDDGFVICELPDMVFLGRLLWISEIKSLVVPNGEPWVICEIPRLFLTI